jgi:hypothetical protein
VDLVPAESIDGSFVPRRWAVASVEVDGEIVVAGPGSDPVFFRLDPLASLIWSCLDGSGTADQIASDLAAELGAAPSVVSDDVVGLTRMLGRLCFLEGVRCDETLAPVTLLPAPPDDLGPRRPRRMVEPPSG